MRRLLSGFIACLVAGPAFADEEFLPAVRIEAGGKPIDIDLGGFSGGAPFVVDFDGDGLNDLIVGAGWGKLQVYRNLGTKAEPRFDGFQLVEAGEPSSGLGGSTQFRPQLVDLAGDGRLDLVCMSDSGMIERSRRQPDGRFAEPELLKQPNGQVLSVAGFGFACYVADWDGDGDNDLILSGVGDVPAPAARGRGDRVTKVWLVENRGMPRAPAWSAPVPLEAGGEPIQAGPLSNGPLVADWNGDGKPDLLLGSRDGSLLLFENVGEPRAPRLAKSRMLLPQSLVQRRAAGEAIARGREGNFCVVDWNGDGKLDLLAGDSQYETLPAERPDAAGQIDRARNETGEVLTDYRRLRALSKRLVREPDAKGKEFATRSMEQQLKRLEELQAEIARLEQGTQPRQVSHGFIWLLQSTGNR